MLDDHRALWALVAEVLDAVEAELDELVGNVEDRVLAWMQATNCGPSAALHEPLRRAVSAIVRDALARVRSEAELPQELLPDLTALARLGARSHCELAGPATSVRYQTVLVLISGPSHPNVVYERDT